MQKKLLLALIACCAWAAGLSAQTTVETVTTGLFEPYGVAVDPFDNAYYFTDSANNRVMRYHPQDQPTVNEIFSASNPQGMAWTGKRGGSRGSLVIAETGMHQILIVPLDGSAMTIVGDGKPGKTDAPAEFNYPYGVAVDPDGNIYVADNQNGSVRKIALDNKVSTVASGFSRPAGVAATADRLFVTDTGNGDVVTLDTAGNELSRSHGFVSPRALLWMGGTLGLLVSDGASHTISSLKDGLVSLYSGATGSPGFVNAGLRDSRYKGPAGLALDANGYIIIADLFNSALRDIKRPAVTTPLLTYSSAIYTNAIDVAVTNKITQTNVTFYYTLDSSEPSIFSPKLGAGVNLNGSSDDSGQIIFKVRGISPDFSSSAIVSNTYTFIADAPVFSITGGNFSTNVTLKVGSRTIDSLVSLTNAAAAKSYVGTNEVINDSYGWSGVLTAQATKKGYISSAITSNLFQFTVNDPVITPGGATTNNAALITITNATPGTLFTYTLDGTVPTASSVKVTDAKTNGPIVLYSFTLDTNALGDNSLLSVRGFKDGYTNSGIIKQTYSFKVGDLRISTPGGSFFNSTNVSITTPTTGTNVSIRYTTDGTTPTTSTGQLWTNGVYGTSGKLVARAFKDGYISSDPITNEFKFVITDIAVIPNGGFFTNDVLVTFTNQTEGTVFQYSTNGTAPDGSLQTASSFTLKGNAPGTNQSIVKVIGLKAGFLPNSSAAPLKFVFDVADPVVTAPTSLSATNINFVQVNLQTGTTGAAIFYSTNGAAPTLAYDTAAGISITTTNPLIYVARRANYNDSSTFTNSFLVQVDKPRLSPAFGFFPSGGTVTVVNDLASSIFTYTTDGSEPTFNSKKVTNGVIKIDPTEFPSTNVRTLKVRAFATGKIPSDIASGVLADDNTIGVPADLVADIGSEIVVPVVLNLKSNQVVKSFQFNVHFAAGTQAALHNAGPIDSLSRKEDLVGLTDGSFQTGLSTNWSASFFITNTTSGIVTNALSVFTKGLDSNFAVKDFGVVALLKLRVPSDAVVGDKFTVQVTNPSATEDGLQKPVALTALPSKTIEIKKLDYLAGDTSPSGWYNAGGDFGNGELDNSDVNNVYYASFQIRLPYAFSDLFNAMDVFPPPNDGNPSGGDDDIRQLDYETVLAMSLRKDKDLIKTFKRSRNAAGKRIATNFALGGQPLLGAETLGNLLDGFVWFREANLTAGSAENSQPGQTVKVPVNLDVLPGKTISGLQYRIQVVPVGAAPAITEQVTFTPADGLPLPLPVNFLPVNEVAGMWSLGSFTPALQGHQQIGSLSIKIPASAQTGQAYRLQFKVVDGAPNLFTQYNFESFPGFVWVNTSAPAVAGTISDEWKTKFFGSATSVQADPMADPDGDGIPNWKEYLAGTNPTDALSKLGLKKPALRTVGGKPSLALSFLSAPGKTYVVEATTDLSSNTWTVVAQGVVGDGSLKEILDSGLVTQGKFYRIRLQ